MNIFLIHRLRNAAIAADQRRDFAVAELLTEAIAELEKPEEEVPENGWLDVYRAGGLL